MQNVERGMARRMPRKIPWRMIRRRRPCRMPQGTPRPVYTRHCGDIGFLLDFHCDLDRLHIDIEVTSLYDIFFQHQNDVVAIM